MISSFYVDNGRWPGEFWELKRYSNGSDMPYRVRNAIFIEADGDDWRARSVPAGLYAGHYLALRNRGVYFHPDRPARTNDFCLRQPLAER